MLIIGEGGESTALDVVFGAVTFFAHKITSRLVRVSQELLEDSAFNMAQVLGEALGIRIGRITATHYATGDDSSKPQGVTTFASAGVTAASATLITGDEMISLQDSLDPAWEANGGERN